MVIGTSLVTATPYVAGRGVHPSAGTAARLTGTAATMASTPNTAINARLIGALPSPATRLVGSEVSPREPTIPGPPAPPTRMRSAALVAVGRGQHTVLVSYDVIVIGGGSAGAVVAARLRQAARSALDLRSPGPRRLLR